MAHIEVVKFKNLKYFNCSSYLVLDSTFLSGLERLREIHLVYRDDALKLFEQKQRYARVDLKIFQFGLLLDDPAMSFLDFFDENIVALLAENPTRLADEIPLKGYLTYEAIARAPRGSEVNVLNRLTDLQHIQVNRPFQDLERFLSILKNLNNITSLRFSCAFPCDKPQNLFDRLPDHCAALQSLTIWSFMIAHTLSLSIQTQTFNSPLFT